MVVYWSQPVDNKPQLVPRPALVVLIMVAKCPLTLTIRKLKKIYKGLLLMGSGYYTAHMVELGEWESVCICASMITHMGLRFCFYCGWGGRLGFHRLTIESKTYRWEFQAREGEKQVGQMVSYRNQPRFLKQRSLHVGKWPGSLSSYVAGVLFIWDSHLWSRCLFEVVALAIKVRHLC